MIPSFGGKETERLWRREPIRSLDSRIVRTALRKLAILDAAVTLEDLRVPPGNRVEALRGDRRCQPSIRINDQWRICFVWTAARPEDVEIVDYHQGVSIVSVSEKLVPIHPGEVLQADFIEPLGITQHRIAIEIGVPPRRINEIVHGKRRITADTALRLTCLGCGAG